MFWKKFFLICLFMFFVVGCGSNLSKQPNTATTNRTKIPFVVLLEDLSKSQTGTDKAMVCWFDLSSGKVAVEKKSLFERRANGEFNFRMVWDGGKNVLLKATPFRGSSISMGSFSSDYHIRELKMNQSRDPLVIRNSDTLTTVYSEKNQIVVEYENGKKRRISLPESHKVIIPYPLLVFGDDKNYQVLVTFNTSSTETKGLVVGKLLLAVVTDTCVDWKEVSGEYCSFIADAGSSVAKYGNQIFITACGEVKVLDLNKEKLMLENNKPINDVLSSVKNKFQEAIIDPVFGTYKDYLLVTAQSSEEKWLWFFNKGDYIGRVLIDNNNSRIETSISGLTSYEALPGKPTYDTLQLPINLYGSWK